jgi:hypothetical protein
MLIMQMMACLTCGMQVALRLGLRLRVHGRQVQQRRGLEILDPLQLLPPLPPPQVRVPWNERGLKEREEAAETDIHTVVSLGTHAASGGGGGGGALDVPPQSKRAAGGRAPLPASTFATGGGEREKLLQLSLFSLREQDVTAVRESFRQRGDVVELADLGDLLRAHLGGQVAPASLLSLFAVVDVNSAGAVSWKEFADAVLDSSLSTLGAARGISGEADNAEGIEASLFEKRVTTSWVPSSGDSWGAGEGIGSRSNVLVGAVFVPQRDLVVCATLEGHLQIFRATTGMRVTNSKEGAIKLPLVPHPPPPRLQSPHRATVASSFPRRASASSVASSLPPSWPASAATSQSLFPEPSQVETQVTRRSAPRTLPRSPLATDSLAGVANNGESSFSLSTAAFNVSSHVICLAALEESSCVAVAMTDGSLRIFDVVFQEQICEYKVHERGEALVTALSSCSIIDPKGDANDRFQHGSTGGARAGAGGARKVQDGIGARILAVGNGNGMLSLVNVDLLLEEVAKGSARASPACLVLSKNVFSRTASLLHGQHSTASTSKEQEPAVNEVQAQLLSKVLPIVTLYRPGH